jgi:hypothetical protein
MNPEKRNYHAKPKLLVQVRTGLRVNHYSKRTEEEYIGWIKRFILFHNKIHPNEMGKVIKERCVHLSQNSIIKEITQHNWNNILKLHAVYRSLNNKSVQYK